MIEQTQATGSPIGVVGLGNIGRGVAAALHRTGLKYLAYDVNPAAASAIEPTPRLAATPREVASECALVGICVFDEDQVRDVLFGADGLLAAGRDGLAVVVISTINPDAVPDIAEKAAQQGARVIDAGVTPGFALPSGQAVSFVGGAAEDVERARPLLSAYSSNVLHVGPLGTGMAAKVARNVATYCIWRAMYEAARIAETAGVHLDQLLEGIGVGDSRSASRPGGAPGIVLDRRGTSDQAAPGDPKIEWLRFLNSTMKKDLTAADQFAHRLGLDLPVLAYTRQHTAETIGLPESLQTDRY